MKTNFAVIISLLSIGCAAYVCAGADAPSTSNPPLHDSATRCQALKEWAFSGLVPETAELVRAAPVPVPGAATLQLPEHCLYRGTLAPRTGPDGQRYGIGFELRLPSSWNGGFVFQGGGGLDGVLSPSYGAVGGADPPALLRGFAVVSTDGGHRSGSMIDAHFGLDQQARIDYAYNALDKTTLLAKALIAQFYGVAPKRSYFVGCSNGGRQALMAAERLPLEFDGIVAGDPSFRLTRTNIAEAWNEIVLAKDAPKDAQARPIISKALSETDLKLVAAAVLSAATAAMAWSTG